ncbi:ABC transporter substrate-binding protein [Micromonospora sp. LOL_015]|uniref:ABC transporter substrate-binding protein n=1 Tax=Micromonospora sp. LOL_015 TaxID=3345416 RepID=UPI003A8C4956
MKMTMIVISGLAVGLLALTSCAAGTDGTTGDGVSTSAVAGEGVTQYPLALENCGLEVIYDRVPQRAVTLNQSAALILIRLGVGDRIVGTGDQNAEPVPDDIADEYENIPLLAAKGQAVRHEALLAAQPDFVYSQMASFFADDQVGGREGLHGLDVPTYLSVLDCVYRGKVDNVSLDLLFEDYANLAEIFDVPAAGERLIQEQQAIIEDGLAAAKQIEGTPTVMWFYSTYNGTPYVAGPGGLPQHVTDLIGAKNVFDGASTKWHETSWDEVASRDPYAIVVADVYRGQPGDTAEEKIAILKSDPLTRNLDAVKNDRFIIIPGRDMDPSFAYAVPRVAEGLVALYNQ